MLAETVVVLFGLLLKGLVAFGHCDIQYGYEVDFYENNLVVTSTGNRTALSNWNLVNNNAALGTLYQSKPVFCVPKECGSGIQLAATVSYLRSGVTTGLGSSDPINGYALFGLSGFDGFQFAFWITETKIFALYSRLPNSQTTLEYYMSGTYLIPIADRKPINHDLLEIWLDPSSLFVSWRMNGYELLRVNRPGEVCIDSKFMIADYGGYFDYAGFPDQVVIQAGTLYPDPSSYTGSPNPACLGALFNDCLDSLCTSKDTQCVYIPPVPPQFRLNATAFFQQVSLTTRRWANTCPQWTCDLRNMDCSIDDGLPCTAETKSSSSVDCVPDWPYQEPAGSRLPWQKNID